MNKLSKLFKDTSQFVSEAAARIFGPNDDAYPETGVQPFSGDRANKKNKNKTD